VKPEDAIRYADFKLPATGTVTSIAPGVHWLRMPLPFALDHINLWLLNDTLNGRQGFTVIDAGVATDASREAWKSVIANHFDGLPILRVLCTHFHPDHVGLAAWLCKGLDENRWTAPLWMNLAEYACARLWSGGGQGSGSGAGTVDTARVADTSNTNHFFRHGITDPQTLEKLKARREYYPSLVPEVPSSFRRIFPNESIRIGAHHWHVIAGYGHSPEHCALYCEDLNLLISGDMVLPKISTNMSVWAQEPDADPLKLYLDSLHAYEKLPDDVLVLPSHGKPFGAAPGTRDGGIKTRIEQLRDHHKARLSDTLKACETPVYASQVLPVLFKRELDLHQLTFALGETVAHLNYLWHAGNLRRFEDAQGRLQFVAA
jgi:glyoxylase-like metal-dependent hydrolase (beta-lactamase superfamily II)